MACYTQTDCKILNILTEHVAEINIAKIILNDKKDMDIITEKYNLNECRKYILDLEENLHRTRKKVRQIEENIKKNCHHPDITQNIISGYDKKELNSYQCNICGIILMNGKQFNAKYITSKKYYF